MLNYQVYYYVTSFGKKPIKQFIDNLQPKEQAKLDYSIRLLQRFGLKVGQPYIKKIHQTPLWELRVKSRRVVRLFFIVYLRKSFLILHGFIKKTNKTPSKEIKVALKRLEEIIE